MASESSEPGRLGGRLADLLRGEWDGPGLTVVGLSRLTGGTGRETWAFDAVRLPARGSRSSVELAAIGRTACEQEWDLLKLIR